MPMLIARSNKNLLTDITKKLTKEELPFLSDGDRYGVATGQTSNAKKVVVNATFTKRKGRLIFVLVEIHPAAQGAASTSVTGEDSCQANHRGRRDIIILI